MILVYDAAVRPLRKGVGQSLVLIEERKHISHSLYGLGKALLRICPQSCKYLAGRNG